MDKKKYKAKDLTKAREGPTQGRLDGFFDVLSTTPNGTKRKSEEIKGSAGKKSKNDGGKKGLF